MHSKERDKVRPMTETEPWPFFYVKPRRRVYLRNKVYVARKLNEAEVLYQLGILKQDPAENFKLYAIMERQPM